MDFLTGLFEEIPKTRKEISKDLGISQSQLSMLTQGKRNLTLSILDKMINNTRKMKEYKNYFDEFADKIPINNKNRVTKEYFKVDQVQVIETFPKLKGLNFNDLALYCYFQLNGFTSDVNLISKDLRITSDEVMKSTMNLVMERFIGRDQSGEYQIYDKRIYDDRDVNNRKSKKEICDTYRRGLDHAHKILNYVEKHEEKYPISNYFSQTLVCSNEKNVETAKEKIKAFSKNLGAKLREDDEPLENVYVLQTFLVPILDDQIGRGRGRDLSH